MKDYTAYSLQIYLSQQVISHFKDGAPIYKDREYLPLDHITVDVPTATAVNDLDFRIKQQVGLATASTCESYKILSITNY